MELGNKLVPHCRIRIYIRRPTTVPTTITLSFVPRLITLTSGSADNAHFDVSVRRISARTGEVSLLTIAHLSQINEQYISFSWSLSRTSRVLSSRALPPTLNYSWRPCHLTSMTYAFRSTDVSARQTLLLFPSRKIVTEEISSDVVDKQTAIENP